MVVEMMDNNNDIRNTTLDICPLGMLYEVFRKRRDVVSVSTTSLDCDKDLLWVSFRIGDDVRQFTIMPNGQRKFTFFVSCDDGDYNVSVWNVAHFHQKAIALFVAAAVRDLAYGN